MQLSLTSEECLSSLPSIISLNGYRLLYIFDVFDQFFGHFCVGEEPTDLYIVYYGVGQREEARFYHHMIPNKRIRQQQ